jgi:UDP-N-acetylmuramate: L-alanyl-gamma-D-glutamyl-meso-diaminopimelate ligase
MKLGIMKEALVESLAQADQVFVFDAKLGWDASAVLRPLGARARCVGELDALVSAIAALARPGDQVLVMSNGDFGGLHEKLLERLAAAH